MRNIRFIILGIIVFIILLISIIIYHFIPYAPVADDELCGIYDLENALVKGELKLRADKTYSQYVIIKKTNEVLSSNGVWTYRKHITNGITFGNIELDKYIDVLKWHDELLSKYILQKPGFAVLPAEYWYGRLIIGRAGNMPDWKKR